MTPPFASAQQWIPDLRRRPWLTRVVRLTLVGLCLGWLYAWAKPCVHPRDVQCGLGYGIAHGALMPMALPSLLMGKDVTIYDENNVGRSYKIGYIIGINACGLVVFGSAFWTSARKTGSADSALK